MQILSVQYAKQLTFNIVLYYKNTFVNSVS